MSEAVLTEVFSDEELREKEFVRVMKQLKVPVVENSKPTKKQIAFDALKLMGVDAMIIGKKTYKGAGVLVKGTRTFAKEMQKVSKGMQAVADNIGNMKLVEDMRGEKVEDKRSKAIRNSAGE